MKGRRKTGAVLCSILSLIMLLTAGCSSVKVPDTLSESALSIAGNGEVTLSSPTPEELQASSPMAFIGIYKQGFNLSYKKAELRGRKVWDVSLKPKKRGQEPSVIIISIDSKTFDPMCIRIRNKKDWTRISINDFKSGAGLPIGHFNYPAKEYPDYEIIDMR